MRDAAKRVDDGLADISIAILYPEDLNRAASQADLLTHIEGARYEGAIFHFSSGGLTKSQFSSADLDSIAEIVNNAFLLAIQNDVVRDHVTSVERVIEDIVTKTVNTDLFFRSEILTQRLNQALGIDQHESKEDPPDQE